MHILSCLRPRSVETRNRIEWVQNVESCVEQMPPTLIG